MTAVLVGAAGLLGLLVGSFLNVVAHRVPRGESVVRPPSACPACGARIRPQHNVPVLGWLVLGGRCRDCSAPVSARYPLVELATGALFAVVAWRTGLSWALPALLYLTAIAVVLAVIDVDVHRLPDAIVLPSYAVGGALIALAAVAAGDPAALARAAVGSAALWLLYFALAVAKPGGMGFGDVKLAGVLGLYLGWLGWAELAVGAALGFLLGGVAGVGLLLARRASRRSAIPFGPFMLAGALLAVLAGDALAGAYLAAVGL
ncbi:A24 family peptidase [Quadrisphaera sp. DSM 44207]|uniref:prepilin peptidase n=1 Tax=Quadrisphaera sp. DSM 44207 TaxID=1881057 RepID=UPI0008901088|nr:A24 family peptidase [Quadrisphaera sp. DSM 44207]SDQ46703.1 leader peptidase (prepilin peptidase) / N-methyltransferase [Quadrisphaera sp. DSM 44207]